MPRAPHAMRCRRSLVDSARGRPTQQNTSLVLLLAAPLLQGDGSKRGPTLAGATTGNKLSSPSIGSPNAPSELVLCIACCLANTSGGTLDESGL